MWLIPRRMPLQRFPRTDAEFISHAIELIRIDRVLCPPCLYYTRRICTLCPTHNIRTTVIVLRLSIVNKFFVHSNCVYYVYVTSFDIIAILFWLDTNSYCNTAYSSASKKSHSVHRFCCCIVNICSILWLCSSFVSFVSFKVSIRVVISLGAVVQRYLLYVIVVFGVSYYVYWDIHIKKYHD